MGGDKRISPDTMIFGVVGYPLSHSLSPVMHNTAFHEKGINAVYLYFPCKDVSCVVCGMRSLSIKGLSITIPYKEKICEYLDEIDPLAERIGAVNTLLNDNGKIIGYNTDAYGAIAALKKEVNELRGKKVLVIGAGGAARAICFGLKEEGATVTVCNRTKERGEKLARDIDAEFIPLSSLKQTDAHIIIQATSVGMYPDVEKSPVSGSIFRPGTVVMDVIYNPLETEFLKMAKKAGCRIITGVDMFVYQGAKQFELWTKKEAPLEVMKKTVLSCLRGKDPC